MDPRLRILPLPGDRFIVVLDRLEGTWLDLDGPVQAELINEALRGSTGAVTALSFQGSIDLGDA